MKSLAATVFSLLCVIGGLAAPRDRVDPKSIKDTVSLTLGTKGMIQFKQQGEILSDPKLAANAGDGKAGVVVELKRDELLLVLTVQNRLSKSLRYRAAIRLKGQTEFVEVSTAPVGAGLASFENWDDPVEEVILFGFKLGD